MAEVFLRQNQIAGFLRTTTCTRRLRFSSGRLPVSSAPRVTKPHRDVTLGDILADA